MDFDMCNTYFQEREAKLKSRSKVHQSIKWPAGATASTAFGIRTADRVWFMVSSSDKADEWIQILRGFIGQAPLPAVSMWRQVPSALTPRRSRRSLNPWRT